MQWVAEGVGRGVGVSHGLRLYDRRVYRKVGEAFGGRLRFFISGGGRLEGEIWGLHP